MTPRIATVIFIIAVLLNSCVSSPSLSVSGTYRSDSGKLVQLTQKGEFLVEREHDCGKFFVMTGYVWKTGTSETSLAVMTRSSGPREWSGAELLFDDHFRSFEVIPYDARFNGVRKPVATYHRVF
jgi:hypothetical protein